MEPPSGGLWSGVPRCIIAARSTIGGPYRPRRRLTPAVGRLPDDETAEGHFPKELRVLNGGGMMTRAPLLPVALLSGTLVIQACQEQTTFTEVTGAVVSFEVVSGDGQTGPVGEELPDPLIVRALDEKGKRVKDQLVNFRVIAGGGSMFAGASITDKHGLAQDYWTLGPEAGENVVEVRAVHPSTGEKQVFSRFTAVAVIPTEEVCNGVDDDLDGEIDEEMVYCIDGEAAPHTDGKNSCLVGWDDLDGDPTNGCEEKTTCDEELDIATNNPVEAAFAVGICKVAQDQSDWGLVSASWVMADGSPPPTDPEQLGRFHLGHGVLAAFGPNVSVLEGSRFLALSSGVARSPADPGYMGTSTDKGLTGDFPEGFPQTQPFNCPLQASPADPAGLELTLRVPENATGFSFDYKFYTADYPEWDCTSYVDQFVAMLSPFQGGQTPGNIALDPLGLAPNANSPETITVCFPSGHYTCPDGTAELQGTGFENHGASIWLTAQAPADPGSEITLRFAIYDSGDGIIDSIVLIDNFRWTGN